MDRKEYKHQHYLLNKDRYKENNHKWLEKNGKYYKKYKDKWYRDNAQRLRDYRATLKKTVFDYYGRQCNCKGCIETNEGFLTIDHVNNDGHKERNSGGNSTQTYRKIIKLGFPNTYQVQCYNCNLGRARNGGVCPHNIK